MPITQYSKIKHRRGHFVDLPTPLEGSELGHAIDERRLFIGNGAIDEGAPVVGNTEILTEFSPIFDIVQYVYKSNTPVEATTGATSATPTRRSLQETLDDRLSVKAYGAIGDGAAIDDEAINRATKDIYTQLPPVPNLAYRIIFFPAGIYYLDAAPVYLPPNTILMGEGKGRTIIVQNNPSFPTMETVDSDFQSGLDIGDNSATLPNNIYIHNMTIEHVDDMDVVVLNRASNVTFIDCEFKSGNTGTTSSHKLIDVSPLGMTYEHKGIHFKYCEFLNSGNVIELDSPNVNHVTFDYCHFSNLFRGITINNTAYNINITNSLFEDITEYALFVSANSTHVTSQNNFFKDCGLPGVPTISSGTGCIYFDTGSSQCSSMNDKFMLNSGVIPVFNPQNEQNFILNPDTHFTFGNVTITKKSDPVAINGNTANASTGVTFDLTEQNTIFIDYSLRRSGFSRTGHFMITHDGTNTAFDDYYLETGDADVTFTCSVTGTIATIFYTTTTPDVGRMYYQAKTWLDENNI